MNGSKLLIIVMVVVLSLVVGYGVAAAGAEEFPLDTNLLAETLKTIAFAGGAGAVAYYVMKLIAPWLVAAAWSDFWVRIASLAVTAVIAWLAWFILMWLVNLPVPVTAQEWVTKLYAVAIASWAANQVIHGLGQKRHEHGEPA